MISLKLVTEENRTVCINLKPRNDQLNFVASNTNSLKKAEKEPFLKPYGIYAGEEMVGFTLFCDEHHPDDGYYWIIRLMIDERFQRKGFGKAAMIAIINKLKNKQDLTSIRISHAPDNIVANKLYKELGFIETGARIYGEIVLELPKG